ncbi:hypothetical protein AB0D14_18460 [Streptomyces sp. NPDC048484]|uniref:hypothetical protein n=1 Tax=Streptomyces sp. NPDC048484 TaxID=3155146 RepID=UPI003436F11E
MTTTDPYRLDGFADNANPAGPGVDRGDTTRDGITWNRFVRTALWLVLVISTVGNMAASYGAASTQVHLLCGVVTALCVSALVVLRLRGRR